jgi:hypothetical protein
MARSSYATLKHLIRTDRNLAASLKPLLKYAAKDFSDLDEDVQAKILDEASIVLSAGGEVSGDLFNDTDEHGSYVLEIDGSDSDESDLENAMEAFAASIKKKLKIEFYPVYDIEVPSPYSSASEAKAAGQKMVPNLKSSYVDAKATVKTFSDEDEEGEKFFYPAVTITLAWNSKAKDWLK